MPAVPLLGTPRPIHRRDYSVKVGLIAGRKPGGSLKAAPHDSGRWPAPRRNFEAQLDSLSNAAGEFIQRSGLGMTAGELRDRSNIVAFLIPFNDDVELPQQ